MLVKTIILIIIIIVSVIVINYYLTNLYCNEEQFNVKYQREKNNVKSQNNDKRLDDVLRNAEINTSDYDNVVASDYKYLTFFENDIVNQSKINETDSNIINFTDVIDYSNVKTGMQKCLENCKGNCYELGYTGSATCDSRRLLPFDYGSIYKNPTFTFGNNAYINKKN